MCAKLKEEGEVLSQLPFKLPDFIHLVVSQMGNRLLFSFFSFKVYI